MPGQGEVLLGAIPMEALDLIVNPRRQEVAGAHGNVKVFKAKAAPPLSVSTSAGVC